MQSRAGLDHLLNPKLGGYLGRWLRALLLWNPLIMLVVAVSFPQPEMPLWRHFLELYGITFFISGGSYGGVAVVDWLDSRLAASRGRPQPQRSRGFHFLLFGLLAFPSLYAGIGCLSRVLPLLGFEWIEPNLIPLRNILTLGIVMSSVSSLMKRLFDTEETARRAENERLRAQLSALNAQMNPHFLFNAMNSVAALIPSDPRKAEDTVVQISDLYRGVLNASRASMHSLSEELAICRNFLEIEKTRFGDRLRFAIEVDAGLEPPRMQLPALTLQPLVENAVKHGIAARANGGKVLIRAHGTLEGLTLEVEDDGVGMGLSPHRGNGTSLAACQERLRLTYGEAAHFEILSPPAGGTRVTLRIPRDPHGSAAPKAGAPAWLTAMEFQKDRKSFLRVVLLNSLAAVQTLFFLFFYTIPHYRETLIEGKMEKVRAATEVAYSVIVNYERQALAGALPVAEAQRLALAQVGGLRFGTDGFFSVGDMQGMMLNNPAFPYLNGRDIRGVLDPTGKPITTEAIRISKLHGESFINYQWPKPGHTDPVPKLAYSKHFKGWNWLVSSGIYMDDVYQEMTRYQAQILIEFALALLLSLLFSWIWW